MPKLDLNNCINQCLFLFGAGASYGTRERRTGCKTSSEMLKALESELGDLKFLKLSKPQIEAFRFVISSLEYHSKWRSLERSSQFRFESNIEELALVIRKIKSRDNFLPYPITGNWADKLIALEQLHDINENFGQTLFESIEKKLKSEFVPSWLQIDAGALDYLDPLINLLSSHNLLDPIECFSLNYDRTIEEALAKFNIKPYTGFISGEWKGMSVIDAPEQVDKIKLYKLHGSIDWVRLQQDGSVKEKNNLSNEQNDDIDSDHNPYVVFGHGSKTFSFDPFFDLISGFKRKLHERNYIFAIGYSFFDPYINNLIIEALNSSPSRRLIIVNPKWGPENLPENDRLKDFDEYSVNKGQSVSSQLTDYIREIQLNSFYSELPEFNLNKISGEDKIHFMNIGFEVFLQNYFNDAGSKLVEFINMYESLRNKDENPF